MSITLWIVVAVVTLVLALGACVFLYKRMGRFAFVRRLAEGRPSVAKLVCAGAPAVAALALVLAPVNTVVVLVHLFAIWAACDLVAWIVRKAKRRSEVAAVGTGNGATGADEAADKPAAATSTAPRPYVAGMVALALTFAYLAYGWVAVHRIVETDYALTTSKPVADLRILQISDSHVGALFDGEGMGRALEATRAAAPDMVVITGDFVDDDTTRADMEAAAAALGSLDAPYGVFFVFGNHDKGYYNSRDFTGDDLIAALEANGVIVLQDQVVTLPGGYALVGRQDKSVPGRATMEALMAQVDPESFTVVLDHQPGDYAAQAASGADLVLSGHTHGGQLIPIGPVSELLGMNDATYGLTQRGATSFIVSSGIADWAILFKTGAVSEFVVIDITRS